MPVGVPVARESSPAAMARVAGALWLVSILGGIFAEVGVRGALIVHGDAVATAGRILAAEGRFRLGFAADLVGDMSYLGVSVLLYVLLKPAGRVVSLVGLAFGAMGCAVMAAGLIFMLAPLVVLGGGVGPERTALAMTFLRLHGQGYSLSIALFAVQVGALGWLVRRSTFFPRVLGVLFAIEAVCNCLSSFGGFLALGWIERLDSYLLLPGLPAEGGMTLWLLIRGVDAGRWYAARVADNAVDGRAGA